MRLCYLSLAANVIPSGHGLQRRSAARSCRRACNDFGRTHGQACGGNRLAEAANAQAKQSSTEALIAHLKLEIEKLRRTLYGTRSERSARLLDQLELELEELEAAATEDELAAEKAAGKTQTVRSFERRRPVRQAFSDDIVRERVLASQQTSA